jgi:hypothetical protein
VGKLLVGGEEQLERRAVLDLPRQRARGAEHQIDLRATLAGELVGHFGEGEAEIGGSGDRRAPLRHGRAGDHRREGHRTGHDREPQAGVDHAPTTRHRPASPRVRLDVSFIVSTYSTIWFDFMVESSR